jgi:hypothetical protein
MRSKSKTKLDLKIMSPGMRGPESQNSTIKKLTPARESIQEF